MQYLTLAVTLALAIFQGAAVPLGPGPACIHLSDGELYCPGKATPTTTTVTSTVSLAARKHTTTSLPVFTSLQLGPGPVCGTLSGEIPCPSATPSTTTTTSLPVFTSLHLGPGPECGTLSGEIHCPTTTTTTHKHAARETPMPIERGVGPVCPKGGCTYTCKGPYGC